MKKNTQKWMVGLLVILIVIVGYMAVGQNIGGTSTTGTTDPNQCGDATGILTVNAVNTLQLGTAVASPTITCGVNGGAVATSVTSGTTTFPVGANLVCLVSKADYIDTEFSATMGCGGLVEQVGMFYSTSDNPSIEIQDKNSNTLTDNIAGGTTNISNLAVGETMKAEVIFTGTALESSGEGIYIIEFPAGSNSNITEGDAGVTLGTLSHISVPSVYSTVNAGSRVDAFNVPAVEGSSEASYNLQVSLQATKDLAGGVYTTWYSKQAFVDTDGTIKVGVQDSTGTAKYENTVDYKFLINSA